MRKLTIIVTCTDRKSARPTRDTLARSLPIGSLSDRSDIWRTRLKSAPSRHPLSALYQGESWSQVTKLGTTVRRAGFEPRILVASAGLGLRDLTSTAPAYGATFTRYQQDSVCQTRADSQDWWHDRIHDHSALDPARELRGQVLLVLSANYAVALEADLLALAQRGSDCLLVGGARDIAGLPRLASDRRLRSHLGGTITGLNMRTAIAWLERLDGYSLHSDSLQDAWNTWASTVLRSENYERATVGDEEVLTFIREARAANPTLPRTRALRLLRDNNLACEQRRFAQLFAQAVSAPCQ
ncbi:hypothetical protein Kfla_0829 [Kribbella flavida DSM 17836]|uniref:Uncharacterized protein n=1 Tax=Kribbella flavida (strain DSM 17836 / JCM 10339 / NBRC 14399) TaxID=479435 RepID=D2PYU5_KRIFD|nr:hypothetical protein Kfla_0829 [Kribbella flavida DSM 17836]